MKNTNAYSTDTSYGSGNNRYSVAAAVPFFKSRWGLLTLLTLGSGLYLYQRRGGSVKSIFSRVWDMGLSARNSIGSIAPSVSGTADTTGDVGTFASDSSSSSSRLSSTTSGI